MFISVHRHRKSDRFQKGHNLRWFSKIKRRSVVYQLRKKCFVWNRSGVSKGIKRFLKVIICIHAEIQLKADQWKEIYSNQVSRRHVRNWAEFDYPAHQYLVVALLACPTTVFYQELWMYERLTNTCQFVTTLCLNLHHGYSKFFLQYLSFLSCQSTENILASLKNITFSICFIAKKSRPFGRTQIAHPNIFICSEKYTYTMNNYNNSLKIAFIFRIPLW